MAEGEGEGPKTPPADAPSGGTTNNYYSTAPSGGGGGNGGRTIWQSTNNARTVAGLMGIAVLFSLIGNEVKASANPNSVQGKSPDIGVTTSARIIIGGFIAAGILVGISGAGEAGRKFAVGLATVSAVTATLVYGGPVWNALSGIVGGTPTGSTGNTSPSSATGAIAPTSGVATVVALGQAA
jgi:hypothetical protein